MRTILQLLITAVLAFLVGLVLPWWSAVAISFLVFLARPRRPFAGFCIAFLAIFLLWISLSYYMDVQNDHILSGRMSLLIFHHRSSLLILVVGALVGAIPSGFAAMTACLIRRGSKKKLPSFGQFYTRPH
ncbi:MAG TPA: hypothetical protein VMV20_01145 [Chitinophagaceae bacterium]|nr:hypothetical protein [Chitinophagaceae bacterium]